MQNKQLVKQLDKAIDDLNEFSRNNSEMEDDPFYKSQITKYRTIICNLCRQIEGLHTEQITGIL